MEINTKNARMLSRLGQRGSIFGVSLPEIALNKKDLYLMTADLSVLSGLSRFESSFPKQFINVGIAEQNMIGIASGLAKEGNCVFATTYATFVSMRSFEQIRNNLGYMKFNVKVIGATAGVAMGMSGNEHYALEDISIMKSIPNLIVLSPADAIEAVKMTEALCNFNGPAYMRLTGALNCPIVYTEDYNFEIGKAVELRHGTEVAIIAIGTMVAESLEAAAKLESLGISTKVLNMHTIKPIDTEALDCVIKENTYVVTVEEHSVIGGLGSSVADHLAAQRNTPPLLKLGLPDAFGLPAEYNYILTQNSLTSDGIVQKILEFLSNERI